jgi:putative beta-lysine N-acetyltransferase
VDLTSNSVHNIIEDKNVKLWVCEDPFNKRIRIDHYVGETQIVHRLISQLQPDWMEKLIIKSRTVDVPYFLSHGLECEGYVDGYFRGDGMFFLVKYFTEQRRSNVAWEQAEKIMSGIKTSTAVSIIGNRDIKTAQEADAERLSIIFREIFEVYPTPLTDADDIIAKIKADTVFVFIEEGGHVVSVASAEINRMHGNAELTDCATLPSHRQKGNIVALLIRLQDLLLAEKIRCHYSLARAKSYGMNKAFANLGFTYGGRLLNNCFIYSGLEDMNIWYKNLFR